MTHILLTAEQAEQLYEACSIEEAIYLCKCIGVPDNIVKALAVLDAAQRVEVVATFGHKFLRPTGTREAMVYCDEEMATGTLLYGSKT